VRRSLRHPLGLGDEHDLLLARPVQDLWLFRASALEAHARRIRFVFVDKAHGLSTRMPLGSLTKK
jgi:hypothetical protein